jgi:hypothetical protein
MVSRPVISAALLAPIGVLLGRIAGGILGKRITGVGVAAATVQVIGLSRWVLLIPGISDDATVPALTESAHRTFEQLHVWLGTILGETVGYALTATFTVLVVIAFTRNAAKTSTIATRWTGYLGYVSAALIATGVVIPLGIGAASITNFIGYVTWCLWLHRHGHDSLAHTRDGSEPDDHNSGSAVHRNVQAVNPESGSRKTWRGLPGAVGVDHARETGRIAEGSGMGSEL